MIRKDCEIGEKSSRNRREIKKSVPQSSFLLTIKQLYYQKIGTQCVHVASQKKHQLTKTRFLLRTTRQSMQYYLYFSQYLQCKY